MIGPTNGINDIEAFVCYILKSTVDLVHFLDFPDVRASFNDVEIELVPEGQSCQFPTREMGNRRKIKTVDDPVDGIQYRRYRSEFSKDNVEIHIDTTTSAMDVLKMRRIKSWFSPLFIGPACRGHLISQRISIMCRSI